MFNEQTVFILGAGASWHYGYPTGEDLVSKISDKCEIAAQFFEHSYREQNLLLPAYLKEFIERGECPNASTAWERGLDEIHRLKTGLDQVNPLVIDYYLGWNPALSDIGRLMIAWVILECEYNARYGSNPNRNLKSGETAEDNWVRFIIHQLAIHCETSKDLHSRNRVSFITFNYDVSLEGRLRAGLSHIKLFKDDDVEKFLSGSRIVHVYGRVRGANAKLKWPMAGLENYDWRSGSRLGRNEQQMIEGLNLIYEASKGLRVIDPHDKGAYGDELMIARRAIHDAKRVFVLGYGFDEHNSRRLGLPEYLRHTVSPGFKSVAYTNYGDRGQVNKRASKVFYGGVAKEMLASGHQLVDRYEKSVRNTYDALAWDFDLAD